MTRLINRVLGAGIVLIVLAPVPASAFPEFLEIFRADALRRPEVDGCATCHVNPAGAGPRNEFGQAFDAAGRQVTPLLRAEFEDRFAYPATPVSGDVRVHFSDPANATVVLETGGERFLVDVAALSVAGAPAAGTPAGGPEAAAASADGPGPADPVTTEGAFFGSRVVNIPTGKAVGAGGVEFLIRHRFTQPVFTSDSPENLFGLDSPARVAFGVDFGFTDWLSVSAMRANDRTIEIGSALQFTEQSEGIPVSTGFRIGVEGRDNFQERFSPHVQFVAARSFGDRFSLSAVPTVAFNTRNEASTVPLDRRYGADKDYTFALGLGGALRVLPSVSIVGEYIPRLSGFKGEVFDRPAVAFGVQKSTYRHTFELVFATGGPMTTSQYVVNGTDQFRIGFNIYRRLR
jgi:hypothetical protein